MICVIYLGVLVDIIVNIVMQVIEQQMIGLDGLCYFNFSFSLVGIFSIILIFEIGMDVDIVQVQVQNKLVQVILFLFEFVQCQGVVVEKFVEGFLMVIGLILEGGDLEQVDLFDYFILNFVNDFSWVEGVGLVQIFGV